MPSAGQSCAHGKLCLTLELRTSLPLPSPASASDALMLFFSSPSCSHVIFVWIYIIIIISVPSPISIAPLHTWHLGCDLLRSVMFSFLAKQSIFSRRPPRMMGVIAGQNVLRTWPSSVSRQLLLLLMALALMFLYLTFHCRQDF